MAKLAAYRAKRDFSKTPEPRGSADKSAGFSFVIQKHDASRLHYDFRLELDGTLKSWAVARGPSLVTGEKRLAVHTEDHPLEYGTFEGTIPKGEYGGGTVLLWDRGHWEPEGDPRESYAKGRMRFRLHGEKLQGGWSLVRMRPRPRERQEQWLLIKSDDEASRPPDAPDILEELPLSVASGRDLDAIAADPSRVWSSAGPPAKKSGKTGVPAGGASSAKASPTKAKKRAPRKKPSTAGTDPMPELVEPCLATLVEEAPSGPKWLHEIKWDGYRLLGFVEDGRARLLSRNGRDWSAHFPRLIEALAALPASSAILDGEAIVEDENGVSNFSALQLALSNETGRKADQAICYAFDLLYLDGRDLRRLPLEERKGELAKLVPPGEVGGNLRFSEHLETDGRAMVRNACRLGLEGIVSKRRDLPYRSGRNADWVKIKCTERQEFVIAGFTPSTAAKNAIGSLVLGYYDGERLVHAGRTGTGFTAEVARDLFKILRPLKVEAPPFAEKLAAPQRRGAVWVRPELVAEVEFRGWTSDGMVRHAAFKGLRQDKDPKEVVREAPASAAEPAAKASKTSRKTTKTPVKSERPGEVAGVELTHPDRLLWEDQGVTKQGLAQFYEEIGDWILPHIVERPLSLVRCPNGAGQGCFYQKHAWAGLSRFVIRERVRDENGEDEVLTVRDLSGLIALVQAGVLEIHPWGSRIATVEQPDRVTIDLDPADDVPFPRVIEAAREARERLAAMGLESFLKTTGGKGLHVVVPLAPKAGWDEVKAFARTLAEAMEGDSPARYLSTAAKKDRRGKIYLDYLRNGRGATAIAAYSTRARPGAPVSVPLAWDELSPEIRPNHFSVTNLSARLSRLDRDPWAEIDRVKQTLPAPKGEKATRKAARVAVAKA